jgi:hypothetical protein
MSQLSLRLDRNEELEVFEKMLSGSISDRILLIHAEGGMGKSHLLREFIANCHKKVLHTGVDFKAGGISLSELLSRLCDALGWEKFNNLSVHINDFAKQSTTFNVTGNTLLGQNQIAIEQALSAPDEDARERQRVALTDAFFADLRSLSKVVLIFDTYNDCDPVVAAWLSGAFLARTSHTLNIIVVIAGRQIPETALDWHAMCHQLVLKGIDSKYFEDYARSEGIEIHPERIRGLCDAFEGRPLPILNQLKAYSLQGRRE